MFPGKPSLKSFHRIWFHRKPWSQFFKNLQIWNHWPDLEMILQEYSLGDPLKNILEIFIKKHGSDECGLLALYGHKEILKNSSPLKPWVRF